MSVILGQHDGDTIVAFGSAGERSARDLLDDCSLLAGMLPEPHPASQVLLVFRHDRYAFTVALLAAWQRGHRVALPANTQRDSIWHVADRPETVQILHDTESGEGLVVAAASSGQAARHRPRRRLRPAFGLASSSKSRMQPS